jgi:CDP-glucose 4,6-dehydratase
MGAGSWTNRRVLITGATGLLGNALVPELLARGAHVVALIRDWNPRRPLILDRTVLRIEVVSGSLEQPELTQRALAQHDIDTVFHLGAQTLVGTALRNPLQTFEANVRGSYLLLEACRQLREQIKSIVVASSDKAYGSVDVLPYLEDTPLCGRHPYDVSKSCADLIAQAYAHTYGLPVVVARCGNLYGAGDLNFSRLVPGTIRSLLDGQRPVIRSDGTFRRDYLHVRDAALGYVTLAERAGDPAVSGRGFNFGPGRSHSVLEVVEILRRLLGTDALPPIVLGEARAEIRDQHLCAEQARTTLGWQAQIPLEQGLVQTIAWYRDYLSRSDVRAD